MASGRHGPVVKGVGTNQSPRRLKSAFTSMIRDRSSRLPSLDHEQQQAADAG